MAVHHCPDERNPKPCFRGKYIPPSRPPLEADISKWQETGDFYFALTGWICWTRTCDAMLPISYVVAIFCALLGRRNPFRPF